VGVLRVEQPAQAPNQKSGTSSSGPGPRKTFAGVPGGPIGFQVFTRPRPVEPATDFCGRRTESRQMAPTTPCLSAQRVEDLAGLSTPITKVRVSDGGGIFSNRF